MAHKVKVKTYPLPNKDGKISKTKKRHVITCRSRGKECATFVTEIAKEVPVIIEHHRHTMMARHLVTHPNDMSIVGAR